MPEIRVLLTAAASPEPVSLALVNAALRLDLDAGLLAAYEAGTAPDDTDPALLAEFEFLGVLRTAAREKVEAYTGRYYTPQTLAISYTLEEAYELPAGAVATSVEGFFTDLGALAARTTFLAEYQKGISVNRQYPLVEALFTQTYTVTADVPADTQFLALAKRAILELTGEWYRNRETTDVRNLTELPVSWRVALAEARVNVLGFC